MSLATKTSRRLKRRLGIGCSPFNSKFGGEQKALFVHGLHKSATMFLFQFFDNLCRQIQVPLYSIHHSTPDHLTIPADTKTSFVLCPIRNFSIANHSFENLETVHLFQTRDPRDILVSEYYSLGWRHSDKDWDASARDRRKKIQSLSIDEYVIQEPILGNYPLVDRYQELLDAMNDTQVHLAKYETMILDFDRWLGDVIPLLGLNRASERTLLSRQYQNEFRANAEPDAHKRNVVPGDHREKLKPETIEILNDRFSTVLDALEYD